jgi:hypothetical protein
VDIRDLLLATNTLYPCTRQAKIVVHKTPRVATGARCSDEVKGLVAGGGIEPPTLGL